MAMDDIKCLRVKTNKYLVPWELASAPASITRALTLSHCVRISSSYMSCPGTATTTLNCNNLPIAF